MPESYYLDYSNQSDEQLDEFLCEYVDGTMDPTVRLAFEEYLELNPDLARHARCLCQTRTMLCSYGCRHPKEESIQNQIRRRVASELFRQSRSEAILFNRLGNAAILTSSVSLLLILGMMVGFSAAKGSQGASLLTDGGFSDSMESIALPSDAYAQPRSALPLDWNQQPKWSGMGPLTSLPTIDMMPVGWRPASTDSLSGSIFQLLATP